ncbi:uncharacterized protein LOC127873721 [Dreissena polymorpha]|uniref:Uncharacterized protein n=1 Tax=Dreissena polymorpha TaxID=45954 RepID=A0A9D4QZJ6_DREPO|nr:uncharacterized protein LOC127873721 [Dreissena polymorpha]KAH3847830.1 hypothetical protein DPMN_090162 [Dreissena polymorpha]
MQLSLSTHGFLPVSGQSFRPVTNWCYRAAQIGFNFGGFKLPFGMTTDMLKLLTKKLKSQSLSEGSDPYQHEDADDEERDSGTESDENFDDDLYGSHTSLDDLPHKNNHNSNNNNTSNTDGIGDKTQDLDLPGAKTHEISEHNFDTVSCTSDYERHSLDFDRHSSEDELVNINKENVREKRKWSDMNVCGYCDSEDSSDDEVKEFLLNPQPVLLSASPPKGVQKVKVYSKSAGQTQRRVLAGMAPITVTSMSPRKRHRLNKTSDKTSDDAYDSDSGPVTQRPCLDFEKMQQVQAFV